MTQASRSRVLMSGSGEAQAIVDPATPQRWGSSLARWYRRRCTHRLMKLLIQAGDWNDPFDDERTARHIGRWLALGADPNGRWRRTWADNGWEEVPVLHLLLNHAWAMDVAWDADLSDAPPSRSDGQALFALRRLLDAGADPNGVRHRDLSGTPTHEMLMGTTAQGMSSSSRRRSDRHTLPLHLAVDDDRADVVAVLLEAGARVDALDHGVSVWDLVNSVRTAQRLADAGGDPLMRNGEGLTRLDVERRTPSDLPDLVGWLEQHALRQTLAQVGPGEAGERPPAPTARPRARL